MKKTKPFSLVEVLIATVLIALMLSFFGQLTTFFQRMKQQLNGLWHEVPEIGFLEIQRRLRTLDPKKGPLVFDAEAKTLSFSYTPSENELDLRAVVLYADKGVFYLVETSEESGIMQKTVLWHDAADPTFTFLGFDPEKKPASWCTKTDLTGPFAPKVIRIASTTYTFDFELPVILQPNELISLHLTPTGNACNSSP